MYVYSYDRHVFGYIATSRDVKSTARALGASSCITDSNIPFV